MAPGLINGSDALTSNMVSPQKLQQENSLQKNNDNSAKNKPYYHPTTKYEYKYKWRNIIVYSYLHTTCFYGLYLLFVYAKWRTVLFFLMYSLFTGLGLTAAAHRYYSHRSFKAEWPFRLILAFAHSAHNQNGVLKWARDHRSHHKFNDTDADPHNINRGIFFAHIGWVLITKHPDVITKGKSIDMSDIKNDRIAMFQNKYHDFLGPFCCFFLPTFVPWYYWGEDPWVAWYVCACLRFVITSNIIWFVSSFGHIKGMQPYELKQSGRDHNIVNYLTIGDGWHNYHHAFPWDYANSEFGNNTLNITKNFIDFFANIGWASNRKTVPLDVVRRRVLRCGDGSHPFSKSQNLLWGWGDKDMSPEEMKMLIKDKNSTQDDKNLVNEDEVFAECFNKKG